MKLSRNYLIIVLILIAIWLLLNPRKSYKAKAKGAVCTADSQCESKNCKISAHGRQCA